MVSLPSGHPRTCLVLRSLDLQHLSLVEPEVVQFVRWVVAVDLERVYDHRQGHVFAERQATWVVPYVVRLLGRNWTWALVS